MGYGMGYGDVASSGSNLGAGEIEARYNRPHAGAGDLMSRAFKMLERAEGYFAAAARRELCRPPYEPGKSCDELDAIRDLLAEMQKAQL